MNLGLVLHRYRMYSPDDMSRQSRRHHDIAKAISARDPDWAEAAMTVHVLAVAAFARRWSTAR